MNEPGVKLQGVVDERLRRQLTLRFYTLAGPYLI